MLRIGASKVPSSGMPFPDSGKISPREIFRPPLVCFVRRGKLVQLLKLDYALVSTLGYPEILRGRMKPAFNCNFTRLAPTAQPSTFNCSSNTAGNDDDTDRERTQFDVIDEKSRGDPHDGSRNVYKGAPENFAEIPRKIRGMESNSFLFER
jgi:hypothetical protein